MNYQETINKARLAPPPEQYGYGSLAGAGAANSLAAPVSLGSLADAFQLLNSRVSQLEEGSKGLWEKVSPFLEPTPPVDPMEKKERRAASPLAEATFELAGRIERVVLGLEEITRRISY